MGGKYTEAQARAIKRYMADRATVSLRISKDEKERIERAAAAVGLSVNNYVKAAVLERLQADERQADAARSDGS